jgi:hypothetical protein
MIQKNYNKTMSEENTFDKQQGDEKPNKPRRPLVISLVFWVFVLWVALGWLRFSSALVDRALILEWLTEGYFWYVALAGLIWGLAGLPILWGILRRAEWIPKILWMIGVLYPAIYWVERLFLWAPSRNDGNWLFMLVLTLLWFGLIIWSVRSKRAGQFFQKQVQ